MENFTWKDFINNPIETIIGKFSDEEGFGYGVYVIKNDDNLISVDQDVGFQYIIGFEGGAWLNIPEAAYQNMLNKIDVLDE